MQQFLFPDAVVCRGNSPVKKVNLTTPKMMTMVVAVAWGVNDDDGGAGGGDDGDTGGGIYLLSQFVKRFRF